jgi:hypothetical protein
MSTTLEIDPYHIEAGRDLDQLIETLVMGSGAAIAPAYSDDDRAARLVLNRLKELTRARVIVGRTALRDRRWFARYETDPSNGTEVFAPTAALAICRLALLQFLKEAERGSLVLTGGELPFLVEKARLNDASCPA